MWPMQADREEVVFGEDVYWLLSDVTYFLIEESCTVRVGHKKQFLNFFFRYLLRLTLKECSSVSLSGADIKTSYSIAECCS